MESLKSELFNDIITQNEMTMLSGGVQQGTASSDNSSYDVLFMTGTTQANNDGIESRPTSGGPDSFGADSSCSEGPDGMGRDEHADYGIFTGPGHASLYGMNHMA